MSVCFILLSSSYFLVCDLSVAPSYTYIYIYISSPEGVPATLEDFIDCVPRDMPLILNLGSYTSPVFASSVDRLMREVYLPYCKGRTHKDIKVLSSRCGGNDIFAEDVVATEKGDNQESVENVDKAAAEETARAHLLTVYIEEAHATDEWLSLTVAASCVCCIYLTHSFVGN
jgi:hypothetical protein